MLKPGRLLRVPTVPTIWSPLSHLAVFFRHLNHVRLTLCPRCFPPPQPLCFSAPHSPPEAFRGQETTNQLLFTFKVYPSCISLPFPLSNPSLFSSTDTYWYLKSTKHNCSLELQTGITGTNGCWIPPGEFSENSRGQGHLRWNHGKRRSYEFSVATCHNYSCIDRMNI